MSSLAPIALAAGLVFAPVCAAAAALGTSRRVILSALLGLFLCGALILGISQSARIGAALLVAGGISVAILEAGLGRGGWQAPTRTGRAPAGRGFRMAGVLLFGTAAWGLSVPFAESLPPVLATRTTAALVVVAIGLLQLGLTQEQGAAGIGLLTTLAGFEVIYAGLEPSLAVRAVVAGIMVGIALVTSILVEADFRVQPPRDRRAP